LRKEADMKPSATDIEEFIARSFPTDDGRPVILVERVDERAARLRFRTEASHLRPGQTVSGPIQMTLADTAAWTLILHNLGFSAAPSVTSNLNISFLSRPSPVDLIGEALLLKLGKRSSVAEVRLFSEGRAEPVAHATVTYAVILAE
jgi:uncharacterized protein (TIGR00369 family)